MKSYLPAWLLFMVTLLGIFPASAYDFQVDGFCYNVIGDKEVSVAQGGIYAGDVQIPSSISYQGETYSVTSIDDEAFVFYTPSGSAFNPSLTSVIIPESVTNIGDRAFMGCGVLTSVTIGEGVTNIGEYVFSGCISLTSVTWNARACGISVNLFDANNKSTITAFSFGDRVEQIPNGLCQGLTGLASITLPESVTSIGEYAFSDCTGLTSITIPESVTSVGWGIFQDCTGLTTVNWNALSCNGSLYMFTNTSVNTFVFGDNIKRIPKYICSGLKDLTSVTIPDSVTRIGGYAFSGCSGLTSIVIPESVTSIEGDAFSSCTGLTTITIPDSVTSIEGDAFSHCTGLTTVNWNARTCEVKPNQFNGNTKVFDDDTYIDTFTFGERVEQIPAGLCQGLSGLTSITIPESVTSIGGGAFSGCTGLTSVAWNARACVDSNNPFSHSKNTITSFIFGNSIEQIPDYLCQGMRGLASITLPKTVTSIGEQAFSDCTGLTSITIPESVTSIGSRSFSGCVGLATIAVGESVTSIGDSAFEGCTGLTTITIPESVASIGDDVFRNCTGLATVNWNARACSSGWTLFGDSNSSTITTFTFGDQVEQIPANLCDGLRGLTSITLPESLTSIGEYAFSGCTGLTEITIPDLLTNIGGRAFSDCTGLTTITIPESVTSIGSSAFLGCTSLTMVNWNARACSIGSNLFGSNNSIITTFTFGDRVEQIPDYLCQGMSGLTTITLPESVTNIGVSTFEGCSGLASVMIGESVISIGDNAFAGCNRLGSVTIHAVTPPEIWSNTFDDYGMPLYVPAGSKSKYQADKYWRNFTNIQETGVALYKVEGYSSDELVGTVMGSGEYAEGTVVTLAAIPVSGYYFVQWSDGNTENPRQITVTEDVSLMAEFSDSGRLTVSTIDDAMGGVTAVLTAIPQEGYRFVRWNDGNTENPRTVVVTGPIELVAEFEAVATGVETQSTGENIYVVNRTLHVENIGGDYRVYTATGQLVYASHAAAVSLADAGVYVVRTSSRSQKVIVK